MAPRPHDTLHTLAGARSWRHALTDALRDPAAPQAIAADFKPVVRAHHIQTISRLTPAMMLANIVNALALLIILAANGQLRWHAVWWALVAVGLAVMFLSLWLMRRSKPFPKELPAGIGRRAVAYAALLGVVWAYPGFAMLPLLTGTPLAFVVALAAGMACGGVISLYPVPLAAMAYSGLISLGALIGVAMLDGAAFVSFAMVTMSFLAIVMRGIGRNYEVFTSEFVRRIELAEKNRVITRLLHESEATASAERQDAQKKLAQAQKMEAIGQLTGGIAHDFNNLLTVVRGNTELLEAEVGVDRSLIQPILDAADRGADLTRHLLAFARRQRLAPRSIDLNRLLGVMEPLLGRTLGPAIEIRLAVAPALWRVQADPGQVESALLNLALNARDAMPRGGVLTIACANVSLDAEDCRAEPEALPGDYVRLDVGDSGYGMSEATQARALEPFFTTKEVGKGSGLGLPMVYGFAKQSGGFVALVSETGEGTTVRLYLPRTAQAASNGAAETEAPDPERGTGQSILVIEDDHDVRTLVTRTLETLGYRVNATRDAATAEELLTQVSPDLVLTDVVLPGGVSGADFAVELRRRRPRLPVLFMSGYPRAAVDRAFLAPDQVLLNKPFTRQKLAEAVRHALANAARPWPDDPQGSR